MSIIYRHINISWRYILHIIKKKKYLQLTVWGLEQLYFLIHISLSRLSRYLEFFTIPVDATGHFVFEKSQLFLFWESSQMSTSSFLQGQVDHLSLIHGLRHAPGTRYNDGTFCCYHSYGFPPLLHIKRVQCAPCCIWIC